MKVTGNIVEVNVEKITIEDNKIELNTDGELESFGMFANVNSKEVSLFFDPSSDKYRWEFSNDLHVAGNLSITDSTSVNSSLFVEGATTIKNTLRIMDIASFNSVVDITKLNVFSTLDVTDSTTINSTLYVEDNVHFNKDLYVNGNLLIIDSVSINSSLEVKSNITSEKFVLRDNISNNTISLLAPDLSSKSSYNLVFPNNYGNKNQLLESNGDGTLKWVTKDSYEQIFGNIITSGDYRTSNTSIIELSNFTTSYIPSITNSSVFLEYKIPYEASIQSDQRISFIITKSINDGPEINIQIDGNLGPKNATGGMRNIYISNLLDINNNLIDSSIKYKIYYKLESEITSFDPDTDYTTIKKAGVCLDTTENYGSFFLKEFSN